MGYDVTALKTSRIFSWSPLQQPANNQHGKYLIIILFAYLFSFAGFHNYVFERMIKCKNNNQVLLEMWKCGNAKSEKFRGGVERK